MNYIETIEATFFGDAESVQGHNQVTRETTSPTSADFESIKKIQPKPMKVTFDFYPGE